MLMSDGATTSADDDVAAPEPPRRSQEEIKRQRERNSRERRNLRFEAMKQHVEVLECAVSVVRFVSEPDEVWDDFLTPEDQRVREYLRKSFRLLEEAKQLEQEQTELKALLAEREKIKQVIVQLLSELKDEDWDAKVLRWRAFARFHFYPWTMEDCQIVMDASIQDIYQHFYNAAVIQSGLMGWRNQYRLDLDTYTLRFNLSKTYRSHNMQHHMDQFWRAYHTLSLYEPIIVGRGRASLDILQRVAPHVSIIRYVENYPGLDINAHVLSLVFRVKTEGGYTMCLRTIECPALERSTDGKDDLWTNNFIWFRWQVLGETDDLTRSDYRLTMGGTLIGETAQYTSRWVGEIVFAAIRGEQWATGRPLLKFTS